MLDDPKEPQEEETEEVEAHHWGHAPSPDESERNALNEDEGDDEVEAHRWNRGG